MKYFTEQIIKWIEDPVNQPQKEYISAHRDDIQCGDISRFIYTNQSINIYFDVQFLANHSDMIDVVVEMDSDIVENRKFYDDGVAFCEFYCGLNILRIVKTRIDDMFRNMKPISCMVYGIELADQCALEFLHAISTDNIILKPTLPKLEIKLSTEYVYSRYVQTKYVPCKEFTDRVYSDDYAYVNQQCTATLLYINLPYSIYSECLNNMHHLNYNLNYNEFMWLRKSAKRFDAICNDIQQNGMHTPITFQLSNNNLIPRDCSSRILIAILLKLPEIPTCIYYTGFNEPFENVYHSSKNTIETLNSILTPYLLLTTFI